MTNLLFVLFDFNNVLDEVVPHVVDRAEHNKDGGQPQDSDDRESDVTQIEISVSGATVHTRQRLDLAQRVQRAGQGPGGGQEVRLGESDEIVDFGVVLQDH